MTIYIWLLKWNYVMKLVPSAGNISYHASIMLDAFHAYYAQNNAAQA